MCDYTVLIILLTADSWAGECCLHRSTNTVTTPQSQEHYTNSALLCGDTQIAADVSEANIDICVWVLLTIYETIIQLTNSLYTSTSGKKHLI